MSRKEDAQRMPLPLANLLTTLKLGRSFIDKLMNRGENLGAAFKLLIAFS